MNGSKAFVGASMLAIAVLLAACGGKEGSRYGPAGFDAAYFGSLDVSDALRGENAWGLRVYNARRTADDQNGTALLISVISPQGAERSGDATAHNYRLYDRLDGSRAVALRHTRTAAVTGAMYVKEAGDQAFCVEFGRDAVLRLLAVEGCNGVKVVPRELEGDPSRYTMLMSAVKIEGGVATELTGVEPLRATDPCPSLCGRPMSLYLWRI